MDTKRIYGTTKELLTSVEKPKETRTYKPVSHDQLIDLTLESIYASGFKLDRETYTSSSNGDIANGRFSISNVADRDMQLEIGWQNSYNKTLTLKFAIGVRIFICQNGCVSGDYGAFKKKHVGEVQRFTPTAITDYINRAGESFKNMQDQRDVMKNIEVSDVRKAELLGKMLIEDCLINTNQITTIAKELKSPTHDYECKDSLWELYQHTTFAMKETNPRFWMDDHIKAHQFFINEAGILVEKTPEIIMPQEPLNQLQLFELV